MNTDSEIVELTHDHEHSQWIVHTGSVRHKVGTRLECIAWLATRSYHHYHGDFYIRYF